MTGQHTLKIEAARAGIGAEEYQARLSQGQLWCYRCQDWHPAGAFPADGRRHTGRGSSCSQAIRAAARDELAGRGQLPPPSGVWVIRRPDPSAARAGGQAWCYWRGPGPGQDRAGTWSPQPGGDIARFPTAGQARDAIAAAYGGPAAVPAGCRLARLALPAVPARPGRGLTGPAG